MEILDGKQTSLIIKTAIRDKIQKQYLEQGKTVPCLACIIVGDNPASQVYVASKEKACNLVGMNSIIKRLPATSSTEDVQRVIEELNQDENVSGILLQLPLPVGLDESRLLETIDPKKHHKIAPVHTKLQHSANFHLSPIWKLIYLNN